MNIKSTFCSSCDLGRFNDVESASSCKRCDVGFYEDEKKSTKRSCKMPLPGMLTNKWDVGDGMESTGQIKSPYKTITDCIVGEYLDDSNSSRGSHKCVDCINGADCSIPTTIGFIRPLIGFRPLKNNKLTFGRCPSKKACPEVEPSINGIALNLSCAEGHNSSSELCSQCNRGYASRYVY